MAKGFINVSTSGSGEVSYYSRSQECLYVQSSKNLSKEVPQLLADWKQLEWQEKMGSKELGIRGRHDAQVRKNYTLSLPNELSPQEAARRIEAMIQQTPIKDCSYSIFIHRGQKDGVTNLHAHLLVNERNLTTRKKDRQMIKKEFLEKEFRPRFEKAFAAERAKGKNLISRERIHTALFQSSPVVARSLLLAYQQQPVEIRTNAVETPPTSVEIRASRPVSLEEKWRPLWRSYADEQEARNEKARRTNAIVKQVAEYLEQNNHPEGLRQVLAVKELPQTLRKELTGQLERYERISELSIQVREEAKRLSLKTLNPFLGSKERAAVSAMMAALRGKPHEYPDHGGYEAASKGSHVKGATYFSTFREFCELAQEPLPSFAIRKTQYQESILPVEPLGVFAAQKEQQQQMEARRAAEEKARREALSQRSNSEDSTVKRQIRKPRL